MNRIGPFSPPPTSTLTTSDVSPNEPVASTPPAGASTAPKPMGDEFVDFEPRGFQPLPWPGDAPPLANEAPTLSASLLAAFARAGQPPDLLQMREATAPKPAGACALSSKEITEAQHLLTRAGFKAAETGHFDEDSQAALLAFQQRFFPEEAPHTGALDLAMLKRLRRAYAIRYTPNGTPKLVQGDSRWGDVKLGNSTRTIHQDGCLLTSATMILNQQLRQKDPHHPLVYPGDLAKLLQAHDCFQDRQVDKKGKIVASGASLLGPAAQDVIEKTYGVKLPLGSKVETSAGADLAKMLNTELGAGRQVILWLDNDTKAGGDHYVIANRAGPKPGEFVIVDPAYGREFIYHLGADGKLTAERPYHTAHVEAEREVDGKKTTVKVPKAVAPVVVGYRVNSQAKLGSNP